MTKVMTVLGQKPVAELGKTLVHEHVLVGFPGWFLDTRFAKFQRQEAVTRVTAAFQQLKDYGVKTVIDPCPSDLGRDVAFIAEVSSRSGVNLICAAGLYFEAAGLTYTPGRLSEEALTEIFVREIEDGVGDTGIRPGIIKIASGDKMMSDYERKVITASAKAAAATGIPVLSHTENCSCGHEQIDIVTGAGVRAEKFLVGHSDGTEDLSYQLSLAERGVFVGFDRFGIESLIADAVRMKNLQAMVDAGHRERVMMSHDYVACWLGGAPGLQPEQNMADVLPNWKMTHIFETIIPELKRMGMSDADFEVILQDNPRRYFSA